MQGFKMMSYSYLQIWLILSRISHAAHKVAPGQPEQRQMAGAGGKFIIARVYWTAARGIGALPWGISPQKNQANQGTWNRMNLQAGGDWVRGLRKFGSLKHVERHSISSYEIRLFCLGIASVLLKGGLKWRDGLLAGPILVL